MPHRLTKACKDEQQVREENGEEDHPPDALLRYDIDDAPYHFAHCSFDQPVFPLSAIFRTLW